MVKLYASSSWNLVGCFLAAIAANMLKQTVQATKASESLKSTQVTQDETPQTSTNNQHRSSLFGSNSDILTYSNFWIFVTSFTGMSEKSWPRENPQALSGASVLACSCTSCYFGPNKHSPFLSLSNLACCGQRAQWATIGPRTQPLWSKAFHQEGTHPYS